MKYNSLKYSSIILSYLAGFVDGEGHIGISHKYTYRGDKTYSSAVPVLTIGNTNKKVLYIFKKFYGGKIYKEVRPLPRKHCYRWKATYKKAYTVVKKLYPYIILKKKQCELIFSYFDNTSHKEKIKLIKLSKKLNRKGRKKR